MFRSFCVVLQYRRILITSLLQNQNAMRKLWIVTKWRLPPNPETIMLRAFMVFGRWIFYFTNAFWKGVLRSSWAFPFVKIALQMDLHTPTNPKPIFPGSLTRAQSFGQLPQVPQVRSCPSRARLVQGWGSVCWVVVGIPSNESNSHIATCEENPFSKPQRLLCGRTAVPHPFRHQGNHWFIKQN